MTDMQLDFNKYRETVRHDRAMEAQQQAELLESIRTHTAYEALEKSKLDETIRHQQAQDAEALRSHQVSEALIREHNRATEDIARAEQDLKLRIANAQNEVSKMVASWNNATTLEKQSMVNDVNKAMNELTRSTQLDIAKIEDARQRQQIEINGQYYELEKNNLTRVNEREDFKASKQAELWNRQMNIAQQNADTARQQYELAEDMSDSEKFANYVGSAGKVLQTVTNILGNVVGMAYGPDPGIS